MDRMATPWRVLDAAPAEGERGAGGRGADDGSRQGASQATNDRRRSVLLGLGLTAVAAAAVVAFLLASGDRGSGAIPSFGLESDPVGVAASGGPVLVVDVGGAVRRPGLYRLALGSRIADAIEAAGGFGPRVDAEAAAASLNLAAPLKDGDRVRVPSRDDRPAATTRPGPAGGRSPGPGAGGSAPIDINHATAAELDALPGIGPATAARILAAREEKPFTSVEELKSRKIVGQSTFDKIRALVTAG